jgi:hypothetical protein
MEAGAGNRKVCASVLGWIVVRASITCLALPPPRSAHLRHHRALTNAPQSYARTCGQISCGIVRA